MLRSKKRLIKPLNRDEPDFMDKQDRLLAVNPGYPGHPAHPGSKFCCDVSNEIFG